MLRMLTSSLGRVIFVTTVGFNVTSPAPLLAWGASGHRMVNRVAADINDSAIGKFLRKNKASLSKLSTTPDFLWKQKSTYQKERFMHFFQWDMYKGKLDDKTVPNLMKEAIKNLGEDYVKKNGTAPWRVSAFYKMLVKSLKKQDWERSLQIAGVLGHYVGDLSQPMHVTKDYDGQSINRPGVHKYFETTLVDKVDWKTLYADVSKFAGAYNVPTSINWAALGNKSTIVNLTVAEASISLDELEEVLGHFGAKKQNDEKLIELLSPNIGRGAATLALIWQKAAEEADVNASDLPKEELPVKEPEWIPLTEN